MADEPAIQSEADLARWCREQLAWVRERLQEATHGGAIYAPDDLASLTTEEQALAMMVAMLEEDGY